ncbi:MAG: hypothetical protein E3J72_16870 [Planctomycetota bacterium]|nr:MAG: hypothetical protein E3J72_16870 [Planctomycetota bacterium]
MAGEREYTDENKVLLEVRPNWAGLGSLLCFCSLLIAVGLLLAYGSVINYDSAGITREPAGSASEKYALAFYLLLITVPLPGAYLALNLFYFLRGKWVIRITRSALLYRSWFHNFKIPWEMLDRIPATPSDKYPFIGKHLVLPLRQSPEGKIISRFLTTSERIWNRDYGVRCILISPRWLNLEPNTLACKIEGYREMFSLDDVDDEE